MASDLAEALRGLDLEVKRAFEGIQKQIAALQQIHTGVEDSDGHTEVWQLSYEDVLAIVPAITGQDVPLTEEALILQTSEGEGGSSDRLNKRLNWHMMELSQKAAEAVDAVGKLNWKPSMILVEARRQSVASALEEKWKHANCKVVPPNSRFRMGWDMFGMALMVCDAFLLPLCIAWDLNLTPFPERATEKGALQAFAILSLTFWPMDLVLNFFTAFHQKGHLITDLASIALNYVKTWFLFDITVVLIDFSASFMTLMGRDSNDILQPLRSARYLRILRTLRILRILKAGKINVMMENLVISMGRQWLILAFTMCKMLVTIGMVTHILSCIWFGVGKYVSGTGHRSWLDLAGVSELDLGLQYVHAATWILLPPAPPLIEPDSRYERLGALMFFIITVLVIGSALSILTGTLNQIHQVNSERSKKRRELRIFLQTRKIPTELTMRIMSYADYKMARHSPVSYDSNMISPMLEAELATVMFGSILNEHPMFWCTSMTFPGVFADMCRALEKKYFCESEFVFCEGALAEMMYITSHGSFALLEENTIRSATPLSSFFVNEKRYFCEVALYVEAVLHSFALRTDSFAEVFVLTASRLARVLSNSPMCATMYIEYATDFVNRYKMPTKSNTMVADLAAEDLHCSKSACENNSFYLELNVDKRRVLKSLDLTYLQERVLDEAEEDLATTDLATTLHLGENPLSRRPFRTSVSDFMREIHGEVTMAQTQVMLREAYVELDPQDGLHARYSEGIEQERAESGILSLIALVRRDYHGFVAPQQAGTADTALTRAQWDELQEVLRWAEPDEERLAGAIFLVAIKGLGKSPSLTRQMPAEDQRPEQALLYILSNYRDAVPTVRELSSNAQDSVNGILELQKSFNFAQMLQGENVPANLLQLRNGITSRGGLGLLQFYVLYLLGFMSGLAGGKGSRFMTSLNATAVIRGLNLMKNVLIDEPSPLYWTYIRERSLELLKHQAKDSNNLALARLACLCRTQSKEDFRRLQKAWQNLSKVQQAELARLLLADGIFNQAIVCEFLPLCLERAKANPFVTVSTFLEVLLDLMQAVRAATKKNDWMVVQVDLNDLAAFALMVKNSYVFQSCLVRSKLRTSSTANRIYLDMTQENWRRVNEPQSDTVVIARGLHHLVRRHKMEHSEANLVNGAVVRCHC